MLDEYFPGQKIIIYDLGLSAAEGKWLKRNPRYIYRKFKFDDYPTHRCCIK